MNAYVNYLIEANLGLCLFLLAYKILFARETDFGLKRIVLLLAMVLSLTFPLLSFNAEAFSRVGQLIPTIWLPEIVVAGTSEAGNAPREFPVWQYAGWLYAAGVIIFLGNFVFQLLRLSAVIRSTKPVQHGSLRIAETDQPLPPFSFFSFIVVGNAASLTPKEKEQIVSHERVHAERYHSLDVLLVNIIGVFFWFNPVIRLYRKIFVQLHEFEADSRAVRNASLNEYCNLLARVALLSADLRIANHFSNSLTLKRIQMMRQIKLKVRPWKIATLAAAASAFFFVVSCNDEMMSEVSDVAQDSHIALNVPPHVQERYDLLVSSNPDKKYIMIEMGPVGDKTLGEIEKKWGLPKAVEVFKSNEEHVRGSSEAGVIIEKGFVANGKESSGGFLILEYDQNTQKMAGLSQQGDVFTIVEETASFPGGMDALYQFIGSELDYPADARTNGISGKVFIEFIVEPDGTVTNVTVKKALHESIDKEAVRVVKASPKWNPGKQDGKPVRQKLVLPVVFALGDE